MCVWCGVCGVICVVYVVIVWSLYVWCVCGMYVVCMYVCDMCVICVVCVCMCVVGEVCIFYILHMRKHNTIAIVNLAYFLYHDDFEFHPCSCK